MKGNLARDKTWRGLYWRILAIGIHDKTLHFSSFGVSCSNVGNVIGVECSNCFRKFLALSFKPLAKMMRSSAVILVLLGKSSLHCNVIKCHDCVWLYYMMWLSVCVPLSEDQPQWVWLVSEVQEWERPGQTGDCQLQGRHRRGQWLCEDHRLQGHLQPRQYLPR